MNIIKIRGPNIDPWGNPIFNEPKSDFIIPVPDRP